MKKPLESPTVLEPRLYFGPSPGPKSSGFRLGSNLPVSCDSGRELIVFYQPHLVLSVSMFVVHILLDVSVT